MNRIIIFSVFCLVAVSRANQGVNDKAIIECTTELNIQPIDKYQKHLNDEDYLKNPDEVMCMRACYYRKWFGTTLYKGLMIIIDEVGDKPYQSLNFTREDVVSRMNDCHEKEPEECKFFKCIDPHNGPIAQLLF